LHTNAVTAPTLALLKKLMHTSVLDDFALAGGTALVLQYGHRLSVDIDLFTQELFHALSVLTALQETMPPRYILSKV
jgi:hypothetical protein